MSAPSAPVVAGMRALLARRARDLAAGAAPMGWKIGLNVPAVQERLEIDRPVVGYLTTATEVADGADVPIGTWTHPAVEPEIAIHMETAVAPGGDLDAARAAIGGLGPALELVDTDLPFEDVEAILSENVFHRGVLLGPARAGDSLEGVAVSAHGGAAKQLEAAVSEDPAEVVRFVADFLGEHGAGLDAGDRIIAGSLTPPIAVAPGDRVEVNFGALGRLAVALAG